MLNVAFNCNEMGILNIYLDNINLDENFEEDDPGNIIYLKLLAWHIKFGKGEELMPLAWHPKRW